MDWYYLYIYIYRERLILLSSEFLCELRFLEFFYPPRLQGPVDEGLKSILFLHGGECIFDLILGVRLEICGSL